MIAGPVRWPVTLSHGAVSLRPLRRRDAVVWDRLRTANRQWTGPWDATRPPGAPEPTLGYGAMVRQFNAAARRGAMLPWGVWYDPGDRPVLAGQLTISGILYGSARWGQAGYWVDQRWAGRQVIPTALALATDHCFLTLGLHRMEVAIRPENAASLRVVEKLGFRLEGRRRRYLHVDGDWRDHDVFVVTAEEAPHGIVSRLR